MSSWKECKLGDVVSSNNKTVDKNYEFENIQYLDTGSLTNNKIDSFQEFNFSPNEISILIVLKNNSTITTSTELKVVLGVSKTLISRSVDSLEKKGLICTCIDEKDSRIHHLQLTGECKPILKIIDEEIGKINKTLFNDVSVEEMKSLKQTMSKLQKCVEERK